MSALEAGKLFERYRIIRQLGSGVSGESYEAEDIILLRKVTLKLIHPWSALTDAARRQFFREMQGISILNHPYLASVLDYGEVNGKLYVARRYVTSGSLLGNDGRLWFRPPLSVYDAIHYGYQLAQVLEYIHKHGYLHGSLGFANILVLRGPYPDDEPGPAPFLLADVGLANFVRRFGEPQIKLLPITAAPEQLGQRVTQASDQFALAVLIYFWLTGRPPYLGSPEEIEEQKLTETIPSLHFLNSKASIEQDVVLRRALTVYPEDRYPSVFAFVNALLATLPVQSQPALEARSTTQLAGSPQSEPQEAVEEVKAAPPVSEGASAVSSPEVRSDSESEFATDSAPSVSPLETHSASGSEPDAEPIVAESQVDLEDETQSRIVGPETDTEHEPLAQLAEDVPQPQEMLDSTPQPTPDVPEPTPDPVPQPTPDIPQPLPTPDVPEPMPDPVPQPTPDPIPQPAPDIPPQVPDPVPQVVPDVPQPLPEPDAFPSIPEPGEQSEPLAEEELPISQEPVTPAQDFELAPSEQEQETVPRLEEPETVPLTRLVIMSPYTEEPYEVLLERDETTIGRAGSSDVLLDHDNSTSRHHALLKREGDHYVLYDRRSANGVFVNGQMLMGEIGYVLEDGDHISIGNYELIFRCKRPETSEEAEENASSEEVTSWSFF